MASAELSSIIAAILGRIDDPALRMNIAMTINMIKEAYLSGGADENEIREDLIAVIIEPLKINLRKPLDEETKKQLIAKAEDYADSIISLFRAEAAARKYLGRLGRIGRRI